MQIVASAIVLIGSLFVLGGIVWTIVALIRRRGRKIPPILTGVAFVVMVVGAALLPDTDHVGPTNLGAAPTNSKATKERSTPKGEVSNVLEGNAITYQETLILCEALGLYLEEEELIHHPVVHLPEIGQFDQPTGFRRICKKEARSSEYFQLLTMRVEESRSQERAHQFIKLIRDWPDTQPLANSWEPKPEYDIDEYVTWELHSFGQPSDRAAPGRYSEYVVAVRKDRLFFSLDVINFHPNEPTNSANLQGIMDSILLRWAASNDSVTGNDPR